MVAAPLVEASIDAGRRLVVELDSEQVDIEAAFWSFRPESSQWRLVLASPLVDAVGPMETYKQLQRIISEHGLEIELRDISVVSTRDELVNLLRMAIQTGPGLSGIRFTGNAINGTFIDDAYIYRMN